MDLQRALKPRPRSELVVRVVHPVAVRAVARLAPLGVDPLHVVLAHGAMGAVASVGIAIGTPEALVSAAVLLAGKVLLDNVDGGLARATGRVTLTGRYLDTLVDFAVNVAIVVALASHGPAWAAGGALLILTFVLSLDHNVQRLYAEARTAFAFTNPGRGGAAFRAGATVAVGGMGGREPTAPSNAAPGAMETTSGAPDAVLDALRWTYATLFAPQDRAIEILDQATGRWVSARAGVPFDDDARIAWNDLFSTAALVNLGLSTQITALAVACLAGAPFAFVALVGLQAAYVVCYWLLRAVRFRTYLRTR